MNNTGGVKVVILVCVGMFVCMLDSTIMNITLPAIQENLHTTLVTSSWMLNVYTMTIAVLAIPMARFADMFGKNKFFIIGLLVFGLGSALCGLSTSGEFLIIARFVQSVGASILIPCSMVIGIAAMPIEKRIIPLTLLGATQGLATALGPSVGGIITEKLSWNWVFYVNVPICIIAIITCLFMLTLKNENRISSKIDWLGLFFSIVTIFSINLVLIKGNSWGWASERAIWCYSIFAVSLILFILAEKKSHEPMVDLRLFKDKVFTGSVVAVSTGFICFVGVMVLLPQFLTTFQHKTELQAALLITPASAAIFIFANLAGLLAKKIGYTIPIILGFSIMGGAYYLLHNLTIASTGMEIIVLCALLGLGFSFVISSATLASTSSFEGEMLTASQGVFSMIRQVGVVLAVAIFVAGLTNNMNHEKNEVLKFAKLEIESLQVPEEAKDKMLAETKESLNNEESDANRSKPVLVTEAQRKQIIDANVKEALASIPQEAQKAAEKEIYQKVEKEVDTQLQHQTKIVEKYTNRVSHYAEKTISTSFADLYKSFLPIVLLCGLTGLIFLEKKKSTAHSHIKKEIAN